MLNKELMMTTTGESSATLYITVGEADTGAYGHGWKNGRSPNTYQGLGKISPGIPYWDLSYRGDYGIGELGVARLIASRMLSMGSDAFLMTYDLDKEYPDDAVFVEGVIAMAEDGTIVKLVEGDPVLDGGGSMKYHDAQGAFLWGKIGQTVPVKFTPPPDGYI